MPRKKNEPTTTKLIVVIVFMLLVGSGYYFKIANVVLKPFADRFVTGSIEAMEKEGERQQAEATKNRALKSVSK